MSRVWMWFDGWGLTKRGIRPAWWHRRQIANLPQGGWPVQFRILPFWKTPHPTRAEFGAKEARS